MSESKCCFCGCELDDEDYLTCENCTDYLEEE